MRTYPHFNYATKQLSLAKACQLAAKKNHFSSELAEEIAIALSHHLESVGATERGTKATRVITIGFLKQLFDEKDTAKALTYLENVNKQLTNIETPNEIATGGLLTLKKYIASALKNGGLTKCIARSIDNIVQGYDTLPAENTTGAFMEGFRLSLIKVLFDTTDTELAITYAAQLDALLAPSPTSVCYAVRTDKIAHVETKPLAY